MSATVDDRPADAAAPAGNTPFYRLGGHDAMQAIVDRFYDLMDAEPDYAQLRAMHAADLTPMRAGLTGFLTGWAGGPREWFDANPGRCMMSVHKPFAIAPGVAGQWAEAMKQAIADCITADDQLAKAMGGALEEMARGMAR